MGSIQGGVPLPGVNLALMMMMMPVCVPQHKNDQHKEGHTAFFARSGKVTCPVAVTERLIKLQPQSFSPFTLVRRIVKAKSKEHFHSSLGVSIYTLREEFKKHIEPFVRDVSKYGTHSMKSGAASNPACRKIAGDFLDIHAGWRCWLLDIHAGWRCWLLHIHAGWSCESTKHGLSQRLAVSKALSI